ncbi:accessory Sec system translocase SecA2 [candidate division CSSED10-310 bacterium]|uniref:Protein translocase subunit SecA n=1 Tax=candidate division CSSED10-310 bacterium TaxID=2855610 RepID=A0ABV6YR65_UNCC1
MKKNRSSWYLKLKHLYHKAQRTGIEYDLTPLRNFTAEINRLEPSLKTLSDQELASLGQKHARSVLSGNIPEKLLVDVFALVRETANRVLSMRPFEVQIMAGLAMHQGKLIEMQTGEGKTLAAIFPAYLNALHGQGVHVLTANDYLAERDACWMTPVYNFLGLETAYIREGMTGSERRRAYQADITYLTAREAGFDYLRDHTCVQSSELVQRPFFYCLVDEADIILIDEARVPLVIATERLEPLPDPRQADEIVCNLCPGTDYQIDDEGRNVNLSEGGLDKVEALLNCGSLHEPENLDSLTSINLACHAHALLHRDKDYIVRDGEIELVDELTGRVADHRRWPHGIHPAVEAKEKLALQPEGMIRGSITMQHFIKLYPKIAGMTATAVPAAEEFQTMYGLTTVVIPPHKPCIRIDEPDLVFSHKEAKERALVTEIARVHQSGQPILVGTACVKESEELATLLKNEGIYCHVLNARHDKDEARLIAQAGMLHAVTISTNMAGRGTDIKLGGQTEDDYSRVADRGGLYVIGTNRHESRRIDNQLRGRAGRQGDPGRSRFFISLEDDLMSRYGIRDFLPLKHMPDQQPTAIQDPVVGREIASIQRIIEGKNFEIRRFLWEYSAIIEEQRKLISHLRQSLLQGNNAPIPARITESHHYAVLKETIGEDKMQATIRHISLFYLDHCWAEHLEWIAQAREGIHLLRYGGKIPLNEFQHQVNIEFFEMRNRLEQKVESVFHHLQLTENGFNLTDQGLKRPTASWTYLINDNPFSSSLLTLIAGPNMGLTASFGFMALLYSPFIFLIYLFRRLLRKFKSGKTR